MKKTFTILLALILVLSLVGCNAAPADNAASNNQNGVSQGDNGKTTLDDTISGSAANADSNQPADNGNSQTSEEITKDEALAAALKHAGVAEKDAKRLEIELDDDGYYDISFTAGGYEYDYDVDAKTGKILKSEKEKDDDAKQTSTSTISKADAKAAALKHAGVAEKDAKSLKIELDDEGYYDISFTAGGYEYDYDVDAKTGNILKSEKEKDDDAQQTATASTVSRTEAKATALKHAGVAEKDARDLEVELDDGYYEVTFDSGGYEYDYKISAKTGKILTSEKERAD